MCICFSENPLKLSLWTRSYLPGEKGAEAHVLGLSPALGVSPSLLLQWPFQWIFPPISSAWSSLVLCQLPPSGESLFRSFLCPIWWYLMWYQHSHIITPGTLSLCSCFLGFLHLISETQVSWSPGGLSGMFRFLFAFTPLILISGICYESWDSLLFHHTSSE